MTTTETPDTTTPVLLTGHTSPDTAYVVADYPYGFRLRCSIRYWIETSATHGQRVMSQTTNPKIAGRVVWNKPKASTYSNLKVLYLDPATGHVESDGLHMYADSREIEAKVATYGAAWGSERDSKALTFQRALAARSAARYEAYKAAQERG